LSVLQAEKTNMIKVYKIILAFIVPIYDKRQR
jgi:hypothetical protein